MTDKEIIQAFLNNDQKGIREVYYAWRLPFVQTIQRLLPNDDDMEDAYQEAFIRLQQHIITERLTQDNIQKSILAYFKTIGRYVALEIINRNNQAHPPLEEESDDIQHIIPIIGTSSSPDEEAEELPIEVDRPFDPNDDMDTQERERIIRQLIERLNKPCAPLLLGYLWDNKSMSDLATELGYKNADSAKSQKSKCMDKVKTFVKQQLIEYGYGY